MADALKQKLEQIEQTLDAGTYRPGPWQRFLGAAGSLDQDGRRELSDDLTRISNKLHRRNGFLEAPAGFGMTGELILFSMALFGLGMDSIFVRLVSVGLLALCLQPGLKLVAGLLLGVRYAYVYLWYFEPRFKMRFGTYFALSRSRKVLFQFAGSIGTPIALLIGWQVLADSPWLAIACLAGFVLASVMQVGAFVAAWIGVQRVGPFLLSSLTTPAALARELVSRDS